MNHYCAWTSITPTRSMFIKKPCGVCKGTYCLDFTGHIPSNCRWGLSTAHGPTDSTRLCARNQFATDGSPEIYSISTSANHEMRDWLWKFSLQIRCSVNGPLSSERDPSARPRHYHIGHGLSGFHWCFMQAWWSGCSSTRLVPWPVYFSAFAMGRVKGDWVHRVD